MLRARYTRLDAPTAFKHLSSPAKFLLWFVVLYLAVWLSCPLLFYRDPSSIFFRPSKAYSLIYSSRRRAESAVYIQRAVQTPQARASNESTPELCLGITSIKRPGSNYLEDAVGSLLASLTDAERARLHLVVFIAHTEPGIHPSVSRLWIHNVADTILTYKNLPKDQFEHLRMLEVRGGAFTEKTVFDYTYLLDTCQKTHAPYIAILEDDVIALDGWFHRTIDAIKVAHAKTRSKRASKWFYLRLFYTEKFLGWNSESWRKYLFYSSLTAAAVLGITSTICRMYPAGAPKSRRRAPNRIILASALLCTACVIGLFFAIGPVSIFPMPAGVHEMAKFGCCSQGLVFPRERVKEVTSFLRANTDKPVDSLIEEYADARNELRWAVVPSLLQHVGSRSSKAGRDTAVTIFNFGFEMNDPEALRNEHLRVIQAKG